MEKLYELDYVKAIGLGSYVAQTTDTREQDNIDIAYVDKTQWEAMFCPTFTNIVGHYPEQENEIMLSRFLIEAMGIDDPRIGAEIPISYTVTGTEDIISETFTVSGIYTEYAHIRAGGFVSIYSSLAFAERYGRTTPDNLFVNIIFKEKTHVDENIERLKQDLKFSEEQEYTQSPAFTENYGNATTYITLLSITAFLMLTGYLLVYNVMYISVSRDVRFYGMLKTLGTTPRQIQRIVRGQILRLCAVGLPLGCAISAAVSLLIVPAVITNSGVDTGAVVSFTPVIYVGAILFASLTALFGAATPARKAAGTSPIEALKYIGESIRKSNRSGGDGVQRARLSSGFDKPFKMALRNIFRDRKRAFVVILSLFMGITVFTAVMTTVSSIDIEYRVNAEYDYDFSLTAASLLSFNDDYIEAIKELPGIKETGVTTLEFAELIQSEEVDRYIDWLSKSYDYTREDVIKRGLGCSLKGLDSLSLRDINKSLQAPIDEEAFKRGEIALINMGYNGYNKEMADCFADVPVLTVKSGYEGEIFQIALGGIVALNRIQYFSYFGPEILVSDTLMKQYYPNPQVCSLDIDTQDGYDEEIYEALNGMTAPAEIELISRYAARKDIRDAKIVMYTLGGGISCILGLIGIFNFINVISVGIMARKRELATLECIGMSKRQMRSMLRSEGAGYAAMTMLCSVTLGNAITYGLFRLFKSAANYAQFSYPLIPVFILYVIVMAICLATPSIVYNGISKLTPVERLRGAE